jgi:prevent-host-death family protein
MTYNVHEAKTHFSKLLAEVEKGEEVVIARAGKPVAKLVPVRAGTTKRPLGKYKGQIWIAPDFDELPEDFLDAFYNGPIEPSEP